MATNDRHFYQPISRGTLLVLVMSGLLYAVQLFVLFAIELSFKGTLRTITAFKDSHENFMFKDAASRPCTFCRAVARVSETVIANSQSCCRGLS